MTNALSESLAARVADGEPVDWERALGSSSDDCERQVIRQLRLVESVARVHSSSGSTPATVRAAGPAAAGIGGDWGPLRLRERLGVGAFGEVYRAWDSRLDREVALKLLRPGSGARQQAATVIEEGRLLAKLRHPNVVAVFGAEVHAGRVGIWMEFIRGRSLEQLLREQGPFGPREAAVIGVELCRALAAVHRARVVHRDVKAANVMREEGGRILLTDFGAGLDEQEESKATISGTPLYMAPELLRGAPASARSDIYSLGVLLYHLVTGSFPVEAQSWGELRDRHARREARLLRDQRPDLPEPFVQAVERALAWEPEARFDTAGRLEQALGVALGGAQAGASPSRVIASDAGSASRRPYSLAGAGILAVALVVAMLLVVPGLMRPPASVPAAGDGAPDAAARVGAAPSPGAQIQGRTLPSDALPMAVQPPLSPDGAGRAGSYRISASLYRIASGSGERERLGTDARLALGDTLTLEIEASAAVHVYVISEDDAGRAFALFPLPGLEPRNPLASGVRHELPGRRDGKRQSWVVDSPGGREHLLVLASPDRLIEFEAEMNALAKPGQAAVPLPESAKTRLRGIGGLAEIPSTSEAGPSAGRLFEMAERLASASESVQGVWMRRIDLENPRVK